MIKLFAPAKVNLNLHVTGKDPRGYHTLSSLKVFLDFGDDLIIEKSELFHITMSGEFAQFIQGESNNLIEQTLKNLNATLNCNFTPKVHLEKNIPVAAGLGGGSTDAAAFLHGMIQLYELDLTLDDIKSILLPLGDDPYVCFWRHSLLRHHDNVMLDKVDLPDYALLLINPRQLVSTADIFRLRSATYSSKVPNAIPTDFNGFIAYLKQTSNDLLEPALTLCPDINDALDYLSSQKSCRFAQMSGSGATCFGVFKSIEEATEIHNNLKKLDKNWWSFPCSAYNEKNSLTGMGLRDQKSASLEEIAAA
jgi:4-diphosphocytidyl-2-C-methyl-D-erythritol kinase